MKYDEKTLRVVYCWIVYCTEESYILFGKPPIRCTELQSLELFT